MERKITFMMLFLALSYYSAYSQCKADFDRSQNPTCVNSLVYFYNVSDYNANTTFLWDFGTGATPATSTSIQPPAVTYSTQGQKQITLRLYDQFGTECDNRQRNIDVIPELNVSFTSTAPECSGVGVNFTYSGDAGLSYKWDLGGDASPATSFVQNPQNVVYNSGGIKTITLIVSNGICEKTITQDITISETPVSEFTSTAPQCSGLEVDFTNTGTSTGVNYSWDFGSNANPATSTVQDPSGIIYSAAGTKTINLLTTDSTSGCFSSASNTININHTPVVNFSSNAPVCAFSDVNFSNTGDTGSKWTYTWDLGTGALPAISKLENPSGIVYNTGGSRIISLTISDGLCSNFLSDTISIFSLPTVDAGLDTTICADRSLQIGSNSISGYSYNWFPSNTLDNPTVSNPVASPIAQASNYVVTIVDTNSCMAIDSILVTMLDPLFANAGVDVKICAGEYIQLGAALIEGQTYSWSPSSGLDDPSSPNPIANPDTTTEYSVTVSGAGCDPVSDEVLVLVHPLPDANAGADDTITVGASTQLVATGGVQYEWSPHYGVDNSGIYNPTVNPTQTTTYLVDVTDIYGCKNADDLTITVTTPSFWIPNAFTPDDNGKNDILYVRGEGINSFEFKIFDRMGHIIFFSEDMYNGWDGRKQVSGKMMPSGAYVYTITGTQTNGEPLNINGLVNLIR